MPTTQASIAFVSASPKFGGAERSLYELVEELIKRQDEFGLRPIVILAKGSSCVKIFSKLGVELHTAPMLRLQMTINPFKLFRSYANIRTARRELTKIFTRNNISFIHANGLHAALYTEGVAQSCGIPLIWHLREASGPRFILRKLLRSSTKVVATSNFMKSWLAGITGTSKKIVTVHNGVAPSVPITGTERNRLRAELGFSGDKFVVGSSGSFVPWKRHEDFIAAVSEAAKVISRSGAVGNGPGAGVLVGGDVFGNHANYAAKLKAEAAKIKGAKFVFTGWKDDARQLVSCCDVFVAASQNEPFGRAVVEAMADGVPVVATDTGARREIIEDGETGLLVPQNSPLKITEAIMQLETNTDLRNKLIEAAKNSVEDKFTTQRVAKEIAAIYSEIIEIK